MQRQQRRRNNDDEKSDVLLCGQFFSDEKKRKERNDDFTQGEHRYDNRCVIRQKCQQIDRDVSDFKSADDGEERESRTVQNLRMLKEQKTREQAQLDDCNVKKKNNRLFEESV